MIVRFVGIVTALFLAVMLVVALHEINKHDLSIQKAATCNLKEKGPIYLVTYADGEGYISNQKVLAESALNNCVDVIYMYRNSHLDSEFVAKNKKILDAKRGAGYWLWKPYVVLKTLQQIPEGAVMIYLDSGMKIIKPLDGFVNRLSGYDMVFVDTPVLNKEYVKRDLFKLFDMDNEAGRNTMHLSGGMFIVRNTARSREFVQKWLDIGQIDGAITDEPSEDEYPEFKEHRHDQSILSLLFAQNPAEINIMSVEDFLDYVYLHRRGPGNNSLFMLDYIAKDWPSIKEYAERLPILERVLYYLLKTERDLFNKL